MLNRHALVPLLAALLSAAAGPALGQDSDTSQVLDSTRSTLSKWMEARQVLSREREDWLLGKEILEERVRLLEAELEEVKQRIRQTRGAVGEADSRRSELRAERDALEQGSTALLEAAASLEAKTRRLVAQLPAPLSGRLAPLVRRLPDDPSATQLSLGQRFQNVIGLLNEISKFNGDLTLVSEVRALPGGGAAEVKTLYLGLAQAWYVSPSGDAAGVGVPGSSGWEWTPEDSLAEQVAHAIAVLEGDEVPAYVPLPMVMQ